VKCARTACPATKNVVCRHAHDGRFYCPKCARKINEYNPGLVEIHAPLRPTGDRPMKAMLVYQGGIANLFEVDELTLEPVGRNARGLYQGDFYSAHKLAQGMGMAGATIRTAHCNQAGNIAGSVWSCDMEDAPFSEKLVLVNTN
jgi:hypothetical protein